MEFKNNEIKRRNPINRNNKFFSEKAFDFMIELGKGFLENVMNETVVLYQVDLEKTKINDIYKEAIKDDIVFKTPIEINVIYELNKAELKTYNRQQIKGYYLKTGVLNFGVYEQTLKELNCDIKRGDYIGLQVTSDHMEYFTVTDDGRKNYDNEHTMYGIAPFYRSISCAVVDYNEFNGI